MLETLKEGWETRLDEFWVSDAKEVEVVDILNRKWKEIAEQKKRETEKKKKNLRT